jgi:uncharacterized protein YegP (UPF0339 family)
MAARTGTFLIRQGRTGKFRFTLQSANGEPVLVSPPYESRREAMQAVRNVKRLAGDAQVVDEAERAERQANEARAAARRAPARPKARTAGTIAPAAAANGR